MKHKIIASVTKRCLRPLGYRQLNGVFLGRIPATHSIMTPFKHLPSSLSLVVDFDSTIVSVEALDELAAIAQKNSNNRSQLIRRIQEITRLGMEGEISIAESLARRLELIKATRSDLTRLCRLLADRLSTSFWRQKKFIKAHARQIYVVTSGFKEYVVPVCKTLGLLPEHVLANSFVYDRRGNITGIDTDNPLCQPNGKSKAVRSLGLKGEIWMVGDGYTDFQVRASGAAQRFVAYVENISRESALRNADSVARSFEDIIQLATHNERVFARPVKTPKALLLEGIHPHAAKALESAGFQVEIRSGTLGDREICKALRGVSLLGIRSQMRITRNLLSEAPDLLAVGAFCVGTNQIDAKACSEFGVVAFNAPYSNTRSVVELAVGEIIMLLRRVFELSSALHAGRWDKSAQGSFEIRGKKLGIVGYGNIGSQLSVLAEALGMQVYYYDIVEKLSLGNARKCRSLNELLRLADAVTLHVDGRAANRNLISDKELRAMKQGAVLLNLSRGQVVDLAALAKHLKRGHIAGAAIDVYPAEPASRVSKFHSELSGLRNVILTPHIGGSTLEAQRNIAEFVAARLIDYVGNGGTSGSVNFPPIELPTLQHAHRLLHIHYNVPGILAKINGILAHHQINILGQYLKTNEQIGYVITDVNRRYDRSVTEKLAHVPQTIRFRVLS